MLQHEGCGDGHVGTRIQREHVQGPVAGRGPLARQILRRATRLPVFLTQQVIGEFYNVVLRKQLLSAADAQRRISIWAEFFAIAPTTAAQLAGAALLAELYRKQFWDMVIVRVAADAGATVLFTEDIGDGERIAGVRILNPYAPGNASLLETLLTPSPETA